MKNALTLFALLATGLPVAGHLAAADHGIPDDAHKQEIERLEGTWEIAWAERDGEKLTKRDVGIDQLVFSKDTMATKYGGKVDMTFLITVDPATKPKSMEWRVKGGNRLPVIYAREGGELRLCLPGIPARPKSDFRPERPKDFDTKGKPTLMLVARRLSR